MLSRLNALKKDERWDEAVEALELEFKKLVGTDEAGVLRLSEMELLALLMRGEPTQVVQHKSLMLATLLSEAGSVAEARGRMVERRQYYLKALHLMLDTFGRGELFEAPEFAPKVDLLVNMLGDEPLDAATQAMLMQHYERLGEFSKAEKALLAIFEAESDNPRALQFAVGFYRRLELQPDAALAAGNLQRCQIESALAELESRLAKAH